MIPVHIKNRLPDHLSGLTAQSAQSLTLRQRIDALRIEREQDERGVCHHGMQVLLTQFKGCGTLSRDADFVPARSPPRYGKAD
jgi:hypothetical protein